MLKAGVRSFLAKMVFLSWLSVSTFGMIGLTRIPPPSSVAGRSSDSPSSSTAPTYTQTLGAVQDVVSTPPVNSDVVQQPRPDSEYQVPNTPQPTYSSVPPPQPAQQTAPQDASYNDRSQGHRPQQAQSSPPPSLGSETRSATGMRLVCVPGVLCI